MYVSALVLTALLIGVISTTGAMFWALDERERAEANETAANTAAADASRQKDAAEHARDEARYESYVANIAAAQALLTAGDGRGARERLDACPEQLRGWEWHVLSNQSDSCLAVREDIPVWDVAFFPDGDRVITAGISVIRDGQRVLIPEAD